jgi:hypothetical protein
LGESPRIDIEARSFTDDELLTFVNGISGITSFLKELVGVELQDYQLKICQGLLGPRNLVVVTGRQVGKDFTIASFSLWESIVRPNSKIVIVSAAQRQSDLLNDRILSFVAQNDQLYASVLKASREELRFKNGSVIYFLPATGLIRGYTEVTRVFVNEARDVPELTYDSITPMLSRRNGHLSVFSTPLGRTGHLWEMWNSPLFDKAQVSSMQNKYLDKNFIESEKLRMSSASFRCEYDGEFISSQQNYFDPTSIQKCISDYDLSITRQDGLRYAIGIDWGRKKDASVMTVVSCAQENVLRVQFIKSFEGVSFNDQIAYVEHLSRAFKPVKIVAEETGLGIGPCDSLQRLGTPLERFRTTSENKARLYDNLRSKLERRELVIPLEPIRLKRQLELLEYEALPSGAVRIGHPSGENDDFADSLALAVWHFGIVYPGPRIRFL